MEHHSMITSLRQKYIVPDNHAESDYFGLVKECVTQRGGYSPTSKEYVSWQSEIDKVYRLIEDEIITNQAVPLSPVNFGTSGWRGKLGKDLFGKSISQVTLAIISLYEELSSSPELAHALGIATLSEAKERGVVIGYDNRFGGNILAQHIIDTLTTCGFNVHNAGEATTGSLSAAVLQLNAACSINLTPSHNPLEYGGFKFNAADAGPAASVVTNRITQKAREIMGDGRSVSLQPDPALVRTFNALDAWFEQVRQGETYHTLNHERIVRDVAENREMVVAVDCVHGASRVHIKSLLKGIPEDRLLLFRADRDYTFGGIAPEPSTANMQMVMQALRTRPEPLKLGVIMDPDADRVRFTDGQNEIEMNQFGAMAYHYLHEIKKKNGMIAKTVATSNFVNSLAEAFNEEVFETRVGFKEFKPVINKALVYFEESDGISIIGHTPEKDAYIGLLLALDMLLVTKKNLGEYLKELHATYGEYYPARDGIVVSQSGEELKASLASLKKYGPGENVHVAGKEKRIKKIIDIDGYKMIFNDESWILIRPSGTEPKVRFYVEARTEQGKDSLFAAAKNMMTEIGLLN